jgi:hypothetical protein
MNELNNIDVPRLKPKQLIGLSSAVDKSSYGTVGCVMPGWLSRRGLTEVRFGSRLTSGRSVTEIARAKAISSLGRSPSGIAGVSAVLNENGWTLWRVSTGLQSPHRELPAGATADQGKLARPSNEHYSAVNSLYLGDLS